MRIQGNVLGWISLHTAILGFCIPVLASLILGERLCYPAMNVLFSIVFVGSELGALVMGVLGRRSRPGQAGIALSGVLLLVFLVEGIGSLL